MLAQAAEIFFETSMTKAFASDAERQRFYSRWFGRYAETQPDVFLLAWDGKGCVLGYIAGCLDSFGEGALPITGDISYFTPAFCAAIRAYPSHFHINVKPGLQGRGTGRFLTAHFIDLCRQAGSTGVHIVTGRASRAVNFYEACGFKRFETGIEADTAYAIMVLPLG